MGNLAKMHLYSNIFMIIFNLWLEMNIHKLLLIDSAFTGLSLISQLFFRRWESFFVIILSKLIATTFVEIVWAIDRIYLVIFESLLFFMGVYVLLLDRLHEDEVFFIYFASNNYFIIYFKLQFLLFKVYCILLFQRNCFITYILILFIQITFILIYFIFFLFFFVTIFISMFINNLKNKIIADSN
jgi:hypothetical protein